MAARILVIEDEPGLMESVQVMLRHSGYTVLAATNGKEGLALAQKESPDLIVTDLMLPGMNGYEICSFLKQDVRYQKIPIFMWSASKVDPKDAALAKECGADDFAIKTLGPRELIGRIGALLAKAKAVGS